MHDRPYVMSTNLYIFHSTISFLDEWPVIGLQTVVQPNDYKYFSSECVVTFAFTMFAPFVERNFIGVVENSFTHIMSHKISGFDETSRSNDSGQF